MNSTLDYLKLRTVAIPYASPAICEFDFSGSAIGELILPPLDSSGLPGLIWEKVGDGWQFTWPGYPGAICYSVFKANGDGSYTVVADCITTNYFVGSEDGCYRIEVILEAGAVSLSDEICVEDDGTTVSYNGLRIPAFSMPRGRFGAVDEYSFAGPAWEQVGSGRVQQPTWSVRLPDGWPTGMRFARATGGFSGKPVRDPDFDQDTLYIGLAAFRAQNSTTWAERNGVEWRIDPQIRITSGPEIPTNGPGEEFVVTLTATNTLGEVTWSTLEDPETWPDWFNLASTGQLSVIPPSTDPYTFTAVVQDTGGAFSLASKNQLEITLTTVCAGTQDFSGDTSSGETWNRVSANGSQPPFYLSALGTAVPFQVHEFTAPCTGQLTADLLGAGGWAVSLTAYSGGFFADYPLCGTPPVDHCYAAPNDYGEPVCTPMPTGECLPVQGNDEYPPMSPEPGRALVSFPMAAGATYFFVVSGFENTDVGAYTLSLSWTPPPPP